MSTYMPKAGDITRNWYVLDAAGKPMGRVAAQAAILLLDAFPLSAGEVPYVHGVPSVLNALFP